MDYNSPETVNFAKEFEKPEKKEQQILQEASRKIRKVVGLSIAAAIALVALFSLGMFFAVR